MPLGLPVSPPEIEYNGIAFDETTKTIGAAAKNVYDQAGRTVKHVVHSLTLQTIIRPVGLSTAGFESQMQLVRRRLLEPGKPFKYKDSGYGNLEVNVGSVTDVDWGPKPHEVSYKPLGRYAAEIVWQVDVAVPECSNAVTRGALMEFNYRLTFTQDRAGWTVRTYQGHVIIPMTRPLGGSRILEDTADNYWEGVIPALPEGFRREVTDRSLDEAKSRLDFTVVDIEGGPNPLPPGIVDCKASHNLESEEGLAAWRGTISAEYECARDFHPEGCYTLFQALVAQRVQTMRAQNERLQTSIRGMNAASGLLLPLSFSMSEPDIYGRPKARFQLNFLLTAPFEAIARLSAMWQPTDTSWREWKSSLERSALHPRGNAKLKHDARDDVIIDLCLGARDATLQTASSLTDAGRRLSSFVGDQCPSPEQSWILYDLYTESQSEDHVIVHKPLPTPVQVGTAAPGLPPPVVIDIPADIVQRRTTNTDEVIVVGKALRVCYDIPQPRLTSVAGRPVVCANRNGEEFFRTGVLGNFGHAVIWAQWRQRYHVVTQRNDMPLTGASLQAVGTPSRPRESTLMTGEQARALGMSVEDWLQYLQSQGQLGPP